MGTYDVNGKNLNVSCVSFAKALELKNAVLKLINVKGLDDIDFSNNADIFFQNILAVAGNSEIDKLLIECAQKAIIGQDKVDNDYFEKPENRKDYFLIMFYILKENLEPFFGGASSLYKNLLGEATIEKSQQLK